MSPSGEDGELLRPPPRRPGEEPLQVPLQVKVQPGGGVQNRSTFYKRERGFDARKEGNEAAKNSWRRREIRGNDSSLAKIRDRGQLREALEPVLAELKEYSRSDGADAAAAGSTMMHIKRLQGPRGGGGGDDGKRLDEMMLELGVIVEVRPPTHMPFS